jgi:hypothetical protein
VSSWYEERRQDKRLDAELRQQRDQADEDRRRKDRADQAEQARKDKREAEQRRKREQAERQQRRAERVTNAKTWLAAESDTAFSVLMILLAVFPSIASQVGALGGKVDFGSAVSLALMLELGAWSATVGGARALRDGRPTVPYRVAMWGCALIAAVINVTHNLERGWWVAAVLGLASIAGVAFWDLRCAGRHGTSRRTKAERAAEKARKAHAKERATAHQDVQRTAERIVSAATFGAVEFEGAFTDAWEVHHGTREVGLTPAMVALRVQSKRRMAEAFGTEADDEALFPDTVPAEWAKAFRGTGGTVSRSPIGTADGDDDEGGEGVPRIAPRRPSAGPSQAAEALGGKGKRQVLGGRRERVQRPLAAEHIEKVRAYADLIAESHQTISVRKVKDLIGGGEKDYLSRLTRHVKQLRGEA